MGVFQRLCQDLGAESDGENMNLESRICGNMNAKARPFSGVGVRSTEDQYESPSSELAALHATRLFGKRGKTGREKDGLAMNGIQHERWRMQNLPCVLDSGYREANRPVLETNRLNGHPRMISVCRKECRLT